MHHLGNVFVTGASGFLGSELVAQLLDSGDAAKIVCLLRDFVPLSRLHAEALDRRVVLVHGDVRDQQLLARIMNEYEICTVFHLAAQTLVGQANAQPVETLDVNVGGTWGILEAVRQNPESVRVTVVASSDKAYGDMKGTMYDETSPLQGRHAYDVSKSCADLIAQAYAASYGTNVCVTRCGNFFGPGDLNESHIFPSVILAALRNEAPVIRSDGSSVRDYLFVKDGAAAYRTLAERMLSGALKGECFNFSYGLRLSVLEVTHAILSEMRVSLEPTILNVARNEIPVQALDSSKARRMLGWEPDVGFQEGLRMTVAWFRRHLAGAGSRPNVVE